MVIYLKPEYEHAPPVKKQKSGAIIKKQAERISELEEELADQKKLLEEAEREAADCRQESEGRVAYDDFAELEREFDFAKSELEEILDNLKYRKRIYEMPELRELIEKILQK